MNKELFNAIRANNINSVRNLIAAGADVNQIHNIYVPLIYAISKFCPNFDIIRELIAAGADVNMQDNLTEQTALIVACENGYLDIVNALIEAGANVNLQNKFGDTALFYLINDLIDNIEENDPTFVEDYKERQNYIRNINLLIKDFEHVLTILLENNADPYLKNNKGKTIFDIATEGGNQEIIDILTRVVKADNEARKESFYLSMVKSEGLPRVESAPLSGVYDELSKINPYLIRDIAKYAFGGEDKDEEGAEESKRDAGGKRRKSVRKKSKNKRKKSGSKKIKSFRRRKSESRRKKSTNRKRRKSTRKKSRK